MCVCHVYVCLHLVVLYLIYHALKIFCMSVCCFPVEFQCGLICYNPAIELYLGTCTLLDIIVLCSERTCMVCVLGTPSVLSMFVGGARSTQAMQSIK